MLCLHSIEKDAGALKISSRLMLASEGTCLVISAYGRVGQMKVSQESLWTRRVNF